MVWHDPPKEYIDIVRKHLPACPIDEVDFFLGEIAEIGRNEESFSRKKRLLEEYESLETAFLELLRAAKKASYEPWTEAFLNWQTSLDFEKDPVHFDFLEEARKRLERVQTHISRIRAEMNSAPHSASRNWKALEIARNARKIWGIAKWCNEMGEVPQGDTNTLFAARTAEEIYFQNWVEGAAPRTQHHDRPGPFGRFLEDLLQCAGLHTADGAVVSAATALASLRNFKRK